MRREISRSFVDRRGHENETECPRGRLAPVAVPDLRLLSQSGEPGHGLVCDRTAANWPASIAATGLALACYPVGVERGFIAAPCSGRAIPDHAAFFFGAALKEQEPNATGHHGFYYHFLDMHTGRRAWQCELWTVDSAFLLAGALTAAAYFDADVANEREIRELADALYRRADWTWAQNRGATVTHGWKPKRGFLSTGGRAMTRRCCSTSSVLALPPTRSRKQLHRLDVQLSMGELLRL